MKSEAGHWKIVPGSLDEWNAKHKPPLRIEQTWRLEKVAQREAHRVALSKTGKTVAIEYEHESTTFCIVCT
jgi:hypothetical protein